MTQATEPTIDPESLQNALNILQLRTRKISSLLEDVEPFEQTQAFKDSEAPCLENIVKQLDRYILALTGVQIKQAEARGETVDFTTTNPE